MTAACTTAPQEVVAGCPVSREKENEETIVTKEAKAEGEAATADTESRATSNVAKRERRKREARELLNHLYTMMDEIKHGSVCPRDEESTSDTDYLESDVYDFETDHDLVGKYKRNGKHHRRAKRNRTTLKEQKFATFCRRCETPKDISLVKGNRTSIRAKYSRCVRRITRDSNRRDQNERRKANGDKKLEKLGVQRRGGPRTTGGVKTENVHEQSGKFEVREENVPKEMKAMLDFLMSLQAREVTPEDYEFLLQLDDLVPNKTVSDDCLRRLREEAVDGSHEEVGCGICMENYEVGEVRKILPCKHAFHSKCIDQWLGQSSTKCPMDGQEI